MERSQILALEVAAAGWAELVRDERGQPQPRDPRREERLRDLLRDEAMAALHGQAQSAPAGSDGERARGIFRGALCAWRERATREVDLELEQLRGRTRTLEPGFEVALIGENDPGLRAETWQRWDAAARRELPLRHARLEERASAARRIGPLGLEMLMTPAQAMAPRPLLSIYERMAVSPLDDRIAAASAERRARSPLPAERAEIDAARDRALVAHFATCPSKLLVRCVRAAGRLLGIDADAGAWRVESRAVREQVWPRLELTLDDRPRVRLGPLPGPVALLRGLAAAGRSARWHFLLAERGAETALFDPAFETAAAVIWARQALSSEFLSELGLALPPSAVADVRLELAVAPRLAWAYLHQALASPPGESGSPEAAGLERLWRRAAGRDATPDEVLQLVDADLRAADALRGWVFALLIEERLLTRHGRRWFVEVAAMRWLRDAWFAEAYATAEDVAEGLGLGKMEPSPIVDRCRP